ncbi:thermonuclease family protein [Mesorhizobium sp. LHD-90]|uniref:thermonuclease family protein n=1 Tax=Mesorhizobium sp. LHD-90 TaxID=3071414 RepID=UPI0027DF85BE|nr:thermonuclease family protein [Mesorhizobium sp. LHD-90]MDQ6437415.1 thermonuclease family protein [Mesorhizobium sp. LHD-90]
MRRAAVLLGAAAVLLGAGILILASGNALRWQAEMAARTTARPGPDEAATGEIAPRTPITTERPAFKSGGERQSASRAIEAEEGAEATPDAEGLERIEPRAALSEIGQALPPKPKMPDEWKGTRLFQPVATAAGLLEAKGYKIAVAGVEPVMPDETCVSSGRAWPCGARARAAFRAWLRGRSVTCTVPPEADRETIVAACLVGKEDAAAWLVENGWARAAPAGDYAALGEVAAQARKGIFGPPPSTSAPAASVAGSDLPAPAESGTAILAAPLADPAEAAAPDLPAPPPVPDGPLGAFPTPPAPPPAPAE